MRQRRAAQGMLFVSASLRLLLTSSSCLLRSMSALFPCHKQSRDKARHNLSKTPPMIWTHGPLGDQRAFVAGLLRRMRIAGRSMCQMSRNATSASGLAGVSPGNTCSAACQSCVGTPALPDGSTFPACRLSRRGNLLAQCNQSHMARSRADQAQPAPYSMRG